MGGGFWWRRNFPWWQMKKGLLSGVEAVIDKDLAGHRLAREVEADIFMILTDVPQVALYFNTDREVSAWRGLGARNGILPERRTFQGREHGPQGGGSFFVFVRDGGECAPS